MPKFVLWTNAPSIHSAPLAAALGRIPGCTVVVVADGPMSAALSQVATVDHGQAKLCVGPSTTERARLVAEHGAGSHHIFTGLGAYRGVSESFSMLVEAGGHSSISLFSEPWNPIGYAAFLRRARFAHRWRKVDSHVDRFLVAGQLAGDQFRSVGAPCSKLHQFGYFVAEKTLPAVPSTGAGGDSFDVVFVGQLIPRKNPVFLLRALHGSGPGLHLTLIGAGPLEARLHRAIAEGRLPATIVGQMTNDQVRQRLSSADLLVLPSEFDGWGAVVNEALAAGTPCLVSDKVGAAALVRSAEQGAIFQAGSLEALKRGIERAAEAGPISPAKREALSFWAREHVSADVAAQYLHEICVDHTRPAAPWLCT